MEALHAVPMVISLIDQQRYSEALNIINGVADIVAPIITDAFPQDHQYTEEESLILAKIFLVRRNYRRCIEHALHARNMLSRLEPVYAESIRYRMMEQLLAECSGTAPKLGVPGMTLREFVLAMVQSDGKDLSYIGFLAEIGEYPLLKSHLKSLLVSNTITEPVLNMVLDMAYEEVLSVFLDIGTEMVHSPSSSNAKPEEFSELFLQLLVDSFVYSDRVEELKAFLDLLPWDKLYHACFYIEDTHHIPLTLSNENANFILSGDWKEEILSNFLFKNSKTSFKFIDSMSKARAPYISFCNSIMNAGTTNDTLYRNNKGILTGKEWSRFLDFASLGMIHHGNLNAFEILKEMLPSLESSSGEPAAQMALGIMNARKCDKETTDYLLNWLDSSDPEMLFGACMGLGLNLLESEDEAVYEKLKALFALDSTVAQESALYAIGMIYAGSDDEEVQRFVYSLFSKSDFMRVKRVCGISASLISSMSLNADPVFSLDSPDALEREGALLSLGSAFVASSDLGIIDRILPYLSDHDDDVKRAAVIAIALVGYEDYDVISSSIIPLAQSYSTHVRAAVALVLGFFSSGIGDSDVCSLLEALLYDSEVLVKQSACIGLGFALCQMNPSIIPNYKRILDKMNYMIAMKSEPACVRIGAALGRSFAEAGGRSVVFSLRNLSKQIEVKRIVGTILFLQSWFWYPLMATVSLCILPTPIFFFDENLDETKHMLTNDAKFYDYLVKLPELKKSRRGRHSRDNEKDMVYEAPQGLKSGSRLTYLERMAYGLGGVVIFRKNEDQ